MTLTTREQLYCLAIAENTISCPPYSAEQMDPMIVEMHARGYTQSSIMAMLGLTRYRINKVLREAMS